MRTLICLFILLLIAVGIGYLIQQDPGYMIVGYHHWTIAMSVWVGLFLILVAFVVIYFLVRLFQNIKHIPNYFAKRRVLLNLQRYQKYTTTGIADLAMGNFRQAEKKFVKLVRKNPQYTTYLLAAQAAQLQQAYARRDEYFKQALHLSKDDAFTISLTQALYNLQADQTDEALVLLKQLYKTDPKNHLLLNGLKTIYFKRQDWQSLQMILPELKKQKLISADESKRILSH